MKVLILAPAKSIHTYRWCSALLERGCEVVLMSMHNDHDRDYDCEVIRLNKFVLNPLNISLVRGKFYGWRPDVVHAHYVSSYGVLSSLAIPGKYVVSVWGHDVYGLTGWRYLIRPFVRHALKKAIDICSTSEVMAVRTSDLIGYDADINVVPFGIDTNVFKPNKDLKKDPVLRIGLVKSLERKYGVDTLIEAFNIINNECDLRLELQIIGNGSLKEDLLKMIKSLGLNGSVDLVGHVAYENLPAYFNKFDIFCCLSRDDSESFGVSSVEAMSCALPVVLSDVDGFIEILGNPAVGILVPREDPRAAAEAMKKFISNYELRSWYGNMAREHVEKNYSWSSCVDKMMIIYNRNIKRYDTA